MDSEVPDITEAISIPGRTPIFVGTYSYIYRGQYNGKDVALKVLRLIPSTTLHAMRRKVYREREVWSHLKHPNITPLCGFTGESEFFGPFGALVSPWYNNGDAAKYLHACGKTMQIEERRHLWQGVVSGVVYLHTHRPMIIHGDLKPTNILIDDLGTPKLCDFGLVHVLSDQNSGMTTTTEHTGTERYLSREIVDSEGGIRPTTASDVYAMGCIGLDFLFLRSPYNYRSNKQKGQICMDILRGVPPAPRPSGLDQTAGRLWDLLECCWKLTPAERVTANEALSTLEVLDVSEAKESRTSTEVKISRNLSLSSEDDESASLRVWASDDNGVLISEGSDAPSNSDPDIVVQADGESRGLQTLQSAFSHPVPAQPPVRPKVLTRLTKPKSPNSDQMMPYVQINHNGQPYVRVKQSNMGHAGFDPYTGTQYVTYGGLQANRSQAGSSSGKDRRREQYGRAPNPPQIATKHDYVYQKNLPSFARIHGDIGPRTFGVNLLEQMERDGVEVPKIMVKCCKAVERWGLDSEGIYRLNGTNQKMGRLRVLMDGDIDSVDLSTDEWTADINNVTGVLKLWLQELPDPLITRELQGSFLEAAKLENDRLRYISMHQRVNGLLDANYSTLKYLMGHLYKVVEHQKENAMTTYNIADIFGPILFGPPPLVQSLNRYIRIGDITLQCKAIETILECYIDIFVEE